MDTKHILLAEDNMINQRVAEKILTKAGYTVTIVADGQEAVNQYSEDQDRYGAILMDVNMPVMDGYLATQEIRKFEEGSDRDRHIPIIAMTASIVDGEKEKCLNAGMDNYLSKPLNLEELLKVLSASEDSAIAKG